MASLLLHLWIISFRFHCLVTYMQDLDLRTYVEVSKTAEVCLVLLEENPYNLSDLQFRVKARERPNQIWFLPFGCQFEVRIVIAKAGISRVSICNISVIFALSHSHAVLTWWQPISAYLSPPRYGISSPGQMPQGCACVINIALRCPEASNLGSPDGWALFVNEVELGIPCKLSILSLLSESRSSSHDAN